MQKPEKPEQPKKQASDKPVYVPPPYTEVAKSFVPAPHDPSMNQYFWSATVYMVSNSKTENCFGVVVAEDGQRAVAKLGELYGVPSVHRHFALVALNRV
jgi:hypothetical protein